MLVRILRSTTKVFSVPASTNSVVYAGVRACVGVCVHVRACANANAKAKANAKVNTNSKQSTSKHNLHYLDPLCYNEQCNKNEKQSVDKATDNLRSGISAKCEKIR